MQQGSLRFAGVVLVLAEHLESHLLSKHCLVLLNHLLVHGHLLVDQLLLLKQHLAQLGAVWFVSSRWHLREGHRHHERVLENWHRRQKWLSWRGCSALTCSSLLGSFLLLFLEPLLALLSLLLLLKSLLLSSSLRLGLSLLLCCLLSFLLSSLFACLFFGLLFESLLLFLTLQLSQSLLLFSESIVVLEHRQVLIFFIEAISLLLVLLLVVVRLVIPDFFLDSLVLVGSGLSFCVVGLLLGRLRLFLLL